MRKPWVLAAASTLALSGCVAQRAEAVARAAGSSSSSSGSSSASASGAPAADGVAVTSARLIADGSSSRLATPGVAARPVAGKPINATCPVMLGNPVDPKVTAEWKGVLVAFCDASARSTWTAEPSRYAGNLPRISGSGGDTAPVVRRRAPSPARVVAAIPKAPSAGAAIGSPDGASDGASRRLPDAPPVVALGSPDGVPSALPAIVRPAALPAVKAATPRAAPVKMPVKMPVAPPPAVPPIGEEDCEDCPGGVCRVPGM